MNIIIYSKPNCTFCEQAKNLLTIKGYTYEERDITNIKHLVELKNLIPDVKTVPQIYINNQYIGGFTQLKEYLSK